MIEAYKRENRDYEHNGDMTLFPESCTVTAELNGAWHMDLLHPVDQEGRWKYITEEAVIAVPTFMGKKQLFRVDDVEKTDTEVTAKAYPVFFDSADDCFLFDVRPTGRTGQQALDEMTAGSRYQAKSNITGGFTAYFVRRNLMDAINGEESPTFLERWGGEILFDNYTVIINEQVGSDHGAEIRYGKNMAAVRYRVDMSQVVTRIVPVAFNGYMMSSGYVDSENIGKYAKVYTKEIRFENIKMEQDAGKNEEEGTIICADQKELDAALKEACVQQYGLGIDLPAVTIEIDLVELSNTEEYKDFQILETIGLGDTVHCYNHILDLSTDARAIRIVWDCIYDEVQTVTLGNYEKNYFSDLSSDVAKIEHVVTSDGGLKAERVKGILNGIQTQLKIQNTVSEKQKVRAILFEDLDPESELYGALSIGTQGWEIANKRTADGRDWEWTTAATANGIVADAVITGLLSDKKGRNFWNLDTGEFSLSSTVEVGGETVEDIARGEVDAQTQEDIFNKLTDQGAVKGILMKDGQLYINATYLLTGIITDGKGKNYWNLDTGEFSLSSTTTVGGKTIGDIAQGKVDEQTQKDILDKLTNDGKDTGIYLLNGKLYISFSAARGGTLTLGGSGNVNGVFEISSQTGERIGYWSKDGFIVNNKFFAVTEVGRLFSNNPTFGNTIYMSTAFSEDTNVDVNTMESRRLLVFQLIQSASASMGSYSTLYIGNYWGAHDDYLPIGRVCIQSKSFSYSNLQFDVYAKTTIYGNLILQNLSASTSGRNAVITGSSNNGTVTYQSSSSRRYKDIEREMTAGDIEKMYKISPVWAKYKKDYLSKDDERYDMFFPMFIAEDVERVAPQAVDHNDDGDPENWNHRVMIPLMFQMLKSQKSTIDDLTERIEKLENLLLKGNE